MPRKAVAAVKESPTRSCPECGDIIIDQQEAIMVECDRCLANKPE